jgi:hypothetical protein
LKGESSIGKTHIAKSVAEYFPHEDVWFIGDMSPKALIHERGTYENGKVYISLENKILVFLETPRKETLEMLKPILSHDRREIEYKIADKKVSGQLGTKSVIICGWPATIFCTTDHKYLEELSTRSMVATPEVTPEKIADVLDYKGEKYARPWKTHTDEEELLFKEALQQLKTGVVVSTPYSKELARRYNHNNGNAPRVMRDFDKLMGLLEMSAFLHQGQRYSFCIPDNGGIQEYCIGNEDDFLIGSALFETVRESTVTGLPQPVLDFYEYVILPMEGELTYRSMMDGYRDYYKRTISQVHLKQKFTDPLVGTGYLLCEKHPTDGRMKIFEKRVSANEMKKIEEYQDFSLKDIFSEEDLKVFMDEIQDIVQENGGDNGDCVQDTDLFYTHEGNLHYFLKEDNQSNRKIEEENEVKKQSCLNLGNSEQITLNCGLGEPKLIDQYDEETVLQQIQEEDTKIEDVVNRFKDLNKVITTIFVLKEKGKVIAGQGYIRRLCRSNNLITQYDEETVLQMIPEENIKIRDFVDRFENPNKAVDTLLILEKKGEIIASQDCMRRVPITETDPDPPGPLNTWTCGMCGVTFKAHIPYEDHRGHAICEGCWKNPSKS